MNQKLLFLSLLMVWFQISLAPLFTIWGVAPDFIFLFFAFFTFFLNRNRVYWWAFGVGLMRDLLSNTFFGLETISLVCGTLVLIQICKRFDSKDNWVQIWATFLSTLLGLIIFLLFFSLVQDYLLVRFLHFVRALFIAGYTTLLMPFLFPLLKNFFRIKSFKKQYELF